MNKPAHNNQGFSLLGILVIIAVLVILGGAGAYVWHRDHKAKATTSTTTTTGKSSNKNTTQPSNNPAVNTTKPAGYSSNDALNLVQSTYTTALAYVKQTTRADQGEIDAVKSSLATSLYSSLSANVTTSDHDQILCGQMQPDSFATSVGATANGTTTVLSLTPFAGHIGCVSRQPGVAARVVSQTRWG